VQRFNDQSCQVQDQQEEYLILQIQSKFNYYAEFTFTNAAFG
jgi:hypothetical protein